MSKKRLPLITLLTISLLSVSAQQEKDFNERISKWGLTVTVAPGGDLWCSDTYNKILYHAENIHSLWHMVTTLGKGHPDSSKYDGGGDLSHIVCPDSNTVLIFGEIHNPFKHKQIRNAYWYSNDRGKTWESRTFASNKEVIKSTYCAPSGEVWIAGDSLYFSADKGLTFTKLNHFPHEITSICMDTDRRTGIAGCYADELYYTEDDWATYRKLPTPNMQHLLDNNTARKRPIWCSVAFLFKKWIIVSQGGERFYSSRDKIRWERFSTDCYPRTTDRENGILFATTENNNIAGRDIIKTVDLQYFDTIYHSQGEDIYGLRASNGELFGNIKTASDYYFCHFFDDSCTRMGFFSDDHPIKQPYFRASTSQDHTFEQDADTYPWGWEKQDILHFDSTKRQWYRVTTTPFEIKYMYPYSDQYHTKKQQVIVGDGIQLWLVNEQNQQLQPFRIERPLDKFLQHPVIQVIISPTSTGCFHYNKDNISYAKKEDLFIAKNAIFHDKKVPVNLSFRAEALDSLLRDLNLHYDTAITKEMFTFTQANFDTISNYFKESNDGRLFRHASRRDLDRLKDTLPYFNDSLIHYILTSDLLDGCTTSNYFEAKIVNSNGDKLVIGGVDASCDIGMHPYMMPVELRTDDLILPCTHIPILQFLGEAMPPRMLTHSNFTDLDVLLKLLRYLTTPEEEWKW